MSCEQQKQDNTSCEAKFSPLILFPKPTITAFFTQTKLLLYAIINYTFISFFFVTCRFLYNQTLRTFNRNYLWFCESFNSFGRSIFGVVL